MMHQNRTKTKAKYYIASIFSNRKELMLLNLKTGCN